MKTIYVIFFFLSALSLLGSTGIMFFLWQRGSGKSFVTLMLFCFHISLIGEEITTFPWVYGDNGPTCAAMEFLLYFFGLMNIVIVAFLVESFYFLSSGDTDSLKRCRLYGPYIVALLPFVTLIPFAISKFAVERGDDDAGWCVLPFDHTSMTTVLVYYVWVWLSLAFSIVRMVQTAYLIIRNGDFKHTKVTFSTVAAYVFVAISSWFPRSFMRISRLDAGATPSVYFIAYLPISISGILYGIIFVMENYYGAKKFTNNDTESVCDSVTMSWEGAEEELVNILCSGHGSQPNSRPTSSPVSSILFKYSQNLSVSNLLHFAGLGSRPSSVRAERTTPSPPLTNRATDGRSRSTSASRTSTLVQHSQGNSVPSPLVTSLLSEAAITDQVMSDISELTMSGVSEVPV